MRVYLALITTLVLTLALSVPAAATSYYVDILDPNSSSWYESQGCHGTNPADGMLNSCARDFNNGAGSTSVYYRYATNAVNFTQVSTVVKVARTCHTDSRDYYVIVKTRVDDGIGNFWEFRTAYGHIISVQVYQGQTIAHGTLLGTKLTNSPYSGCWQGPHVHVETDAAWHLTGNVLTRFAFQWN